MAKTTKVWHPNFIEYMDMIVNHENYKGLAIERKDDGSLSWIATAKSDIGEKRIQWCLKKAKELNIENKPGVYAEVMLRIHPTKRKVCQTCGKEMSLYYHYPNANFLKDLNRRFNSVFSECDDINYIWDSLIEKGENKTLIASFLIEKGDLLIPVDSTKDEIICKLELACRKGNKKCLGPGAMSNFPDRYDGFHTYNRCCRSSQDKGRSKENLKSYTKDRRAYEYWSDGNIHAANQFMGSSFFDGISADHIGPISLGFVHDSRYLQPMSSGDNSSKRDRLQLADIEKIIKTERRTNVYPMSWYSSLIWEHIKRNYINNLDLISTTYRNVLKQNMSNFMHILWIILNKCGEKGKTFLINAFLKPNYTYFNYTYKFNELGEIIEITPRHFTDRNANEIERYTRVAIEAVYDYNDKKNRNTHNDLTSLEINSLNNLCHSIAHGEPFDDIKKMVTNLMLSIQKRLISNI